MIFKCENCGTQYDLPETWPTEPSFVCIDCLIKRYYNNLYERVIEIMKQMKAKETEKPF